MVGADRVSMSVQARRRMPGLRQTLEQPLPQGRAGIVLGRTTRPSRRLLARMAQADDQGPAQRSGACGPTVAACYGIPLRDEPLRQERHAPGGDRGPRDGAHHDGVAGRGPRGVRMADRDEASSRMCARVDEEAGRPCAGPHPVKQDALRPAHGRHPRASGGGRSQRHETVRTPLVLADARGAGPMRMTH
jgi:hypothetical protein